MPTRRVQRLTYTALLAKDASSAMQSLTLEMTRADVIDAKMKHKSLGSCRKRFLPSASALEDMRSQMEVIERWVLISSVMRLIANGSQLYLLKNPNVVGIVPNSFTAQSFQPPGIGHNPNAPASSFSAAQTSNTTVRWKRKYDEIAELQANSRVVRWSDGSLTLQIASNPMEQLQLPGKPLAAIQFNPTKPTPTSINNARGQAPPYDPRQNAHTYLASVQQEPSIVQVTNHVTASLTLQSSVEENDDALQRLQESMAAAIKGTKGIDNAEGPTHIRVTEDPELAKRKAEIAEREKGRADKRRQNQEQRQRERQAGIPGRRTGAGSGLTVGGLEDERASRPKPARKPRRRNSEYSDEEEDYRQGKGTREDEYDQDDGFLVGSDEEPELVDDDGEDEDEGLDGEADADGEEEVQDKPARSPKVPREGDGEAATGGRRRRKIVDDDDDDE